MSTGATGGAALASVVLRGGGTLSVWADRLEATGVSYPMADIAWAGLVNDPAAPPGAQPLPAVAWRLANGQYASATPADPPQAWQVLEVIFTQRPDLRIPLPPPAPSAAQPGAWVPPPHPGSAPGQAGYGYAPGYAPYPPPPQPNDNQTVMAGLAHLSIFFGALIVPLILWLVNRGKAPYAAQQSKQAFFFHLALFVVGMVIFIPGYIIIFTSMFAMMPSGTVPDSSIAGFFGSFFILWGALFAIQIVGIIFGIIGAVKAFQGQPFHYPLMGRI